MAPARPSAYPLQAGLLALVLFAGSGCRTPIGVQRADPESVRSSLDPTLIASGRLSDQSRTLLRYLDLGEAYQDDPAAALAKLHGLAAAEDLRGMYAVLAEL